MPTVDAVTDDSRLRRSVSAGGYGWCLIDTEEFLQICGRYSVLAAYGE